MLIEGRLKTCVLVHQGNFGNSSKKERNNVSNEKKIGTIIF